MLVEFWYGLVTAQWPHWCLRIPSRRMTTWPSSVLRNVRSKAQKSTWPERRRWSNRGWDTSFVRAGDKWWRWVLGVETSNWKNAPARCLCTDMRWLWSEKARWSSATAGKNTWGWTQRSSSGRWKHPWGNTHMVPKAAWTVHASHMQILAGCLFPSGFDDSRNKPG
eukprot:5196370-Amphidinium_carterae.3